MSKGDPGNRTREAALAAREEPPPSQGRSRSDHTAPLFVGRFEVVERSDECLKLVSRSRSEAYAVRWGAVAGAVLFPAGCVASAMYGGQVMALMIGMFGGIMVAVLMMLDFARIATAGTFTMTERSLEILRSQADMTGYREGSGAAVALWMDGRLSRERLRDVLVLAEPPLTQGARAIFRVYLVLERGIVTLEVTRNKLAALRLASLVRRTLGLPPLEAIGDEHIIGTGCLVTALVVVLELTVVAAGIFLIATTTQRDFATADVTLVGVITTGMVLSMIGVKYLCAIPVGRAVRDHVRLNLGGDA